MKKIFMILFSLCFILTSCNRQNNNQEEQKQDPPITYPTYTNEEIRQNLKSKVYEFQSRIKDKNQFKFSGEFNAPDKNFNGMYIYKNMQATLDANTLDPYIKFKTDVYLKENNIISEEPTQRIEFIRKTEGNLINDTIDYVLEDYIDEKNKIYSKTINERNGNRFNLALQTILRTIKEFSIEDIPNSVIYSYNRDNASYGMKFKFKDLQGTPVHEYLNILLSFVPELNELLIQFKDDVIININDIKLDTPITTFNIDITYPTMQGAFEFNVIHGKFELSFKTILRDDVTKFNINDTYLKSKLGNNNVSKYLKEFTNNEGIKNYKCGLVLDLLSIIDLSKIDINNIDIPSFISNKKIKIEAPSSLSIKYYDRFNKRELIIKDNTIDFSLLDIILIEIIYEENSILHNVKITQIKDNNTGGEIM